MSVRARPQLLDVLNRSTCTMFSIVIYVLLFCNLLLIAVTLSTLDTQVRRSVNVAFIMILLFENNCLCMVDQSRYFLKRKLFERVKQIKEIPYL